MKLRTLVGSIVGSVFAAHALGATTSFTANFDSLPEGGYGDFLLDNTIEFRNPTNSLGQSAFTVDAGPSALTAPNIATIGGWIPGLEFNAIGQVRSFTFGLQGNGLTTGASLIVLTTGADAGKTLTLEGYLHGINVASGSIITGVPADGVFTTAQTLSIPTGLYDGFKLVAPDIGVGFDTVTLTVPEPGSVSTLLGGVMLLATRRHR